MAHNFFTPGKRSLAVIDEMVNDKYPEPLTHQGKNVKKKEDIEQKTKKTKMIQQSKYCVANHFKAPGIRKTIFFLFFLLSATCCCDLKQRNLLPDNSQGKNLSVYNNRHLSFSVLFRPCDVLRSDNFSLHFLLYLYVPLSGDKLVSLHDFSSIHASGNHQPEMVYHSKLLYASEALLTAFVFRSVIVVVVVVVAVAVVLFRSLFSPQTILLNINKT